MARISEEERKRRKNAARNARYAADPERARRERQRAAGYRRNHPDKVVAGKAAHYQRNKRSVRAQHAAHYRQNRTKYLEHARLARLAADPVATAAANKAYRAQNAEKIDAVRRAYRKANKATERGRASAWYYENQERARKRIQAWQAVNSEKKIVYSQNSRARRKTAAKSGRLSMGLAEKLLRLQRGLCAACRCGLKSSGYHLDHVMPLARGGENVDANIQLLCPSCNLTKHARHPVVFMQSRGFLL